MCGTCSYQCVFFSPSLSNLPSQKERQRCTCWWTGRHFWELPGGRSHIQKALCFQKPFVVFRFPNEWNNLTLQSEVCSSVFPSPPKQNSSCFPGALLNANVFIAGKKESLFLGQLSWSLERIQSWMLRELWLRTQGSEGRQHECSRTQRESTRECSHQLPFTESVAWFN